MDQSEGERKTKEEEVCGGGVAKGMSHMTTGNQTRILPTKTNIAVAFFRPPPLSLPFSCLLSARKMMNDVIEEM